MVTRYVRTRCCGLRSRLYRSGSHTRVCTRTPFAAVYAPPFTAACWITHGYALRSPTRAFTCAYTCRVAGWLPFYYGCRPAAVALLRLHATCTYLRTALPGLSAVVLPCRLPLHRTRYLALPGYGLFCGLRFAFAFVTRVYLTRLVYRYLPFTVRLPRLRTVRLHPSFCGSYLDCLPAVLYYSLHYYIYRTFTGSAAALQLPRYWLPRTLRVGCLTTATTTGLPAVLPRLPGYRWITFGYTLRSRSFATLRSRFYVPGYYVATDCGYYVHSFAFYLWLVAWFTVGLRLHIATFCAHVTFAPVCLHTVCRGYTPVWLRTLRTHITHIPAVMPFTGYTFAVTHCSMLHAVTAVSCVYWLRSLRILPFVAARGYARTLAFTARSSFGFTLPFAYTHTFGCRHTHALVYAFTRLYRLHLYVGYHVCGYLRTYVTTFIPVYRTHTHFDSRWAAVTRLDYYTTTCRSTGYCLPLLLCLPHILPVGSVYGCRLPGYRWLRFCLPALPVRWLIRSHARTAFSPTHTHVLHVGSTRYYTVPRLRLRLRLRITRYRYWFTRIYGLQLLLHATHAFTFALATVAVTHHGWLLRWLRLRVTTLPVLDYLPTGYRFTRLVGLQCVHAQLVTPHRVATTHLDSFTVTRCGYLCGLRVLRFDSSHGSICLLHHAHTTAVAFWLLRLHTHILYRCRTTYATRCLLPPLVHARLYVYAIPFCYMPVTPRLRLLRFTRLFTYYSCWLVTVSLRFVYHGYRLCGYWFCRVAGYLYTHTPAFWLRCGYGYRVVYLRLPVTGYTRTFTLRTVTLLHARCICRGWLFYVVGCVYYTATRSTDHPVACRWPVAGLYTVYRTAFTHTFYCVYVYRITCRLLRICYRVRTCHTVLDFTFRFGYVHTGCCVCGSFTGYPVPGSTVYRITTVTVCYVIAVWLRTLHTFTYVPVYLLRLYLQHGLIPRV